MVWKQPRLVNIGQDMAENSTETESAPASAQPQPHVSKEGIATVSETPQSQFKITAVAKVEGEEIQDAPEVENPGVEVRNSVCLSDSLSVNSLDIDVNTSQSQHSDEVATVIEVKDQSVQPSLSEDNVMDLGETYPHSLGPSSGTNVPFNSQLSQQQVGRFRKVNRYTRERWQVEEVDKERAEDIKSNSAVALLGPGPLRNDLSSNSMSNLSGLSVEGAKERESVIPLKTNGDSASLENRPMATLPVEEVKTVELRPQSKVLVEEVKLSERLPSKLPIDEMKVIESRPASKTPVDDLRPADSRPISQPSRTSLEEWKGDIDDISKPPSSVGTSTPVEHVEDLSDAVISRQSSGMGSRGLSNSSLASNNSEEGAGVEGKDVVQEETEALEAQERVSSGASTTSSPHNTARVSMKDPSGDEQSVVMKTHMDDVGDVLTKLQRLYGVISNDHNSLAQALKIVQKELTSTKAELETMKHKFEKSQKKIKDLENENKTLKQRLTDVKPSGGQT